MIKRLVQNRKKMINWLRITWMLILNFFSFPIWMYKISAMGKEKIKADMEERHQYLQKIVQKINRSGRISVKASGLENLPDKNGYVLFPNHQGFYDSLALIAAHPRSFSVVLKKEAADYFLVKQVIRLIKGIPADRKNMKEFAQIINKISEYVKGGGNFLIFPEGTRSRQGNRLVDMKAGAFKSAYNAKAPIVPVALIDSFRPLDEFGLKKTEVGVHFLKPLYYEEYKELKTLEIAKTVHDRIQVYIDEHI